MSSLPLSLSASLAWRYGGLTWPATAFGITHAEVQATPVTIYTPDHGQLGPAVVIAHGFAGSEVLMQSFALTFARNGYVAVTFDFPGHGRNPKPLTGSITDETGATRVLVGETERIVALARTLGDGRVALLGHSMASDIVVRAAEETPEVMATIAVSMFSPAVTATAPRNLLVIVGDWESTLKDEALRAVGLATGPLKPEAGHTYGDIAAGYRAPRRVQSACGARKRSLQPDQHERGARLAQWYIRGSSHRSAGAG